jgi:amino acid transporter
MSARVADARGPTQAHNPRGMSDDDRTPLRGRKAGDRRVRVARPHATYFRYQGPGRLEARAAADVPATAWGKRAAVARRVAFGRPLASEEELTERLPKWKALAVFSSDVMSSVAYATEASMYTLLAAGTAAFALVMPISALIVLVLGIVTFSYRQTIRAYPGGGGSYIVAHANLGVLPGLVAAAALLTDYVLTVSVSVSSGIFNLASAFPVLHGTELALIVASILFVMGVNLRGLRESGTVFAAPTYIFVVGTLVLVVVGLVQTLLGKPPHVTDVTPIAVPAETLGVLLVMRAFADGSSAMTGTEAVANGVPAFQPVEWRNARTTMAIMATLLATMFLGISYLATTSGAVPSASESVLSQVTRAVFGRGAFYYVLLIATMGILILAAQTSFADFPRLASILGRDGFMPRQLAFRGERLAFNAGIVVLAVISIVVCVAFNGQVNALIPLYAIGVFTAFTLSQAGMVRHWFTERSPGWRRSAAINGVGATATGIVAIIFGIAKFALGAWVVIVIVPLLVAAMLFVRREYDAEEREIGVRETAVIGPPRLHQEVVVAAMGMNRAVVQAIKVGRTMSDDVRVVHVAASPAEGERIRERLERQVPGVPIVLVESPYRTLVRPFVRYLEVEQGNAPGSVVIVLIPTHVPRHWWDRLLYNRNGIRLKEALVGKPGIVVLEVPYRRSQPGAQGVAADVPG